VRVDGVQGFSRVAFASLVLLFGSGVQWGVAFRFSAVSLFIAADCCFAWMGAVDKIKTQIDR
jgi:hypothetical protein